MAVASILPAVRRDLEGASNAARRQDDRAGAEDPKSAAFSIVTERPRHTIAVLQERDHRTLHVHIDPAMNAVVLQCADHLQTGAIANVRQPGIPMAAEVPLQNSSIRCAIEQRAPRLELANPIGRLFRVQLRHSPVVDVLAAAHGVGEVHAPIVSIVDVAERRGGSPLRHNGVRLSQQRLAHEPDARAVRRCLDRRPQARPARADHEHIMIYGFVVTHQILSHSLLTPSNDPPIVPHTHRAHSHIQVGECHTDETGPRPSHVPTVQTARAIERDLFHAMLR